MEKNISKLVLNTNFADVNVGGNNADCTFNNINFRNLLGNDFELGAKYSINLNNICLDDFTLSNFRKSGEIRIISNALMFVNNSYTRDNYGSFMFTASTSPIAISYNFVSNNIFILTSETGYIETINFNMNNNVIFTSTANEFILFFSIRKITNKIPKLLTDNINSTKLVLNSINANVNVGGNNGILTWRNINFKSLLGDDYELNALYNIKLHTICFGSAAVSALYRSGTLEFECNSMMNRHGNTNKWLIQITHTNTVPNSRTFRGAIMNTFMLTSEQGDITINHNTQQYHFINPIVPYPDKLLYFIINKI
jgi:hypothetical protein